MRFTKETGESDPSIKLLSDALSLGQWRWRVNRRFHDARFLERLKTPANLLKPPAQSVERHPPRTTTELVRLTLPEFSSRTFFIKYYQPAKFWNTLKDCFRPSRARRAFENAGLLWRLGIPTALPVTFGERRQMRWLREAFFICEEVPNSITLKDFYLNRSNPQSRQIALRSLARLIARLHNAGFSHTDPHAQNFLVRDSNGENLVMIDLDALRYQRWFNYQVAVRDLRQMLLRSPLSSRDHLRFVAAYAHARSPQLSARKLVSAFRK